MEDPNTYSQLISLCYAGVTDDASWDAAIQSLYRFVGGTGAGLVEADPSTGLITYCHPVDIDPIYRISYLKYYAKKEVRLPPSLKIPANRPILDHMLLDERSLKRSELYNDLLLPIDIPYLMFAWLEKSATRVVALSLANSASGGAFTTSHSERFASVLPHFFRARRLRESFEQLRWAQESFVEVLHQLPFAIALLDRSGQIVWLSNSAQRLTKEGNGLSMSGNRLRAFCSTDESRLQAAISNASREPKATLTLQPVPISKRRSTARYLVHLIPVVQSRSIVDPRTVLIAAISDPEQVLVPPQTQVQALFGITNAEAQLACCLVGGAGLRECADQLGRSLNTVKTQLKSIYAKTGARSHVDLVRAIIQTGWQVT